MSQHTADILTKAKARIDSPEKWTKGSGARTSDGTRTDSESANAACWCMLGAIYRATKCAGDYREVSDVVRETIHTSSISEWNDAPSRTHAEVMAAFDKAIAAELESA